MPPPREDSWPVLTLPPHRDIKVIEHCLETPGLVQHQVPFSIVLQTTTLFIEAAQTWLLHNNSKLQIQYHTEQFLCRIRACCSDSFRAASVLIPCEEKQCTIDKKVSDLCTNIKTRSICSLAFNHMLILNYSLQRK